MRYLAKLNPKASPLFEAVEYGAASYGYGYLMSRYREKASVMGVPADLLGGVLMKAASLFGGRYLRGFTAHANVLGNAGIGAFCHTLGSGHGAAGSGVKRLLIHESDVPKAKAALPNATILGDIPKAPHGDFLSFGELNKLAK